MSRRRSFRIVQRVEAIVDSVDTLWIVKRNCRKYHEGSRMTKDLAVLGDCKGWFPSICGNVLSPRSCSIVSFPLVRSMATSSMSRNQRYIINIWGSASQSLISRTSFKNRMQSFGAASVLSTRGVSWEGQRHGESHNVWSLLALAAGAGAAVGGLGCVTIADGSFEPHHVRKDWNMLNMEQRRRSFFTYEKRIREFSPPEKVFEYFASEGSIQKGYHMTPADIMRSVVPVYPPENSNIVRSGSLPGEPNPQLSQKTTDAFQSFDLDASGGFTFDEWLLFQALLSIPREDVAVAFALMDSDGNGWIDSEEFCVMLDSIHTRAQQNITSLRRSVSDLPNGNSGMVVAFFGKDGKGRLTLNDLTKFIDKLREDLLRLEFEFYDYNSKGVITGKDFAHSVVGWARLKHVNMYLDKISEMNEEMAMRKISFEDFKKFRKAIRQSRRLAIAFDFWRASGGKVTRDDMNTIIERVWGDTLPDRILDIIFFLFSTPEEELNTDYFIAIMDRHHENSRAQPWTAEAAAKHAHKKQTPSFLECLSKCASKRD